MKALNIVYPFGINTDSFVDYQTGEIIDGYDNCINRGYSIHSESECRLIASLQHPYNCLCDACLFGRESLISEY